MALGNVPSSVNAATTEGRVQCWTEYTCRRFFDLTKLAASFFGTAVSSGMLQVQDVVAGNKHSWMARTCGLGKVGWVAKRTVVRE